MNVNCKHASMNGKKINPFARAVTETFNFFIGALFMGHPVFVMFEDDRKRSRIHTIYFALSTGSTFISLDCKETSY